MWQNDEGSDQGVTTGHGLALETKPRGARGTRDNANTE